MSPLHCTALLIQCKLHTNFSALLSRDHNVEKVLWKFNFYFFEPLLIIIFIMSVNLVDLIVIRGGHSEESLRKLMSALGTFHLAIISEQLDSRTFFFFLFLPWQHFVNSMNRKRHVIFFLLLLNLLLHTSTVCSEPLFVENDLPSCPAAANTHTQSTIFCFPFFVRVKSCSQNCWALRFLYRRRLPQIKSSLDRLLTALLIDAMFHTFALSHLVVLNRPVIYQQHNLNTIERPWTTALSLPSNVI